MLIAPEATPDHPVPLSSAPTASRALQKYFDFVHSCTYSFLQEYQLEIRDVRPVDFVYFVDFQEIHSMLAPHVRDRPSGDRRTTSYYPISSFFLGLREKIYLPPGTLIELSGFLTRVAHRLNRVYRELIGAGPIEQLEAIRNFLNQENPSDPLPGIRDVLERDGTATSWTALHIRAATLLANYERGVSQLQSILHQAMDYDLGALVRRSPVRFSTDKYARLFRELQVRRRDDTQANRCDALNLSLALSLTQHFRENSERMQIPRVPVFKLLTDTSTLFRVWRHVTLSMRYSDYDGADVEVLERADEAVFKRALRKRCESGALDDVVRLLRRVNEARETLLHMNLVARGNKHNSMDTALERLLDPGKDFWVLMRGLRPDIELLSDSLAASEEITEGSLARMVQQNAAASTDESQFFAAGGIDPSRILAISNLITDVNLAIQRIDDLGTELSEKQIAITDHRGGWKPPKLGLDGLGYDIQAIAGRWLLTSKRRGPVLECQKLEHGFVFRWATVARPERALAAIAGLSTLRFGDSLIVATMTTSGEEVVKDLKVSELSSQIFPDALSLIRVESSGFTFVSEMSAPGGGASPMTGIICEEVDLGVLRPMFAALSAFILPSSLFERQLWNWLSLQGAGDISGYSGPNRSVST